MAPFALTIALAAALAVPAAAPEDPAALNAILNGEARLAAKPGIYFVVDLSPGNPTVSFRMRGVELREAAVRGVRTWGPVPRVTSSSLRERVMPEAPARETIPGGAGKGGDAGKEELKALELADMPGHYRLVLDGSGLVISVRSGGAPGLFEAAGTALWKLRAPLVTVARRIRGREHLVVDLLLDDEDARALCWAAVEGSGFVVYAP